LSYYLNMELIPQSFPISAVVLTHNSARTLDAVLSSLHFCDEIVVVDSGSSDETLAIAADFGAVIFKKKLVGFGEQKDFGVQRAKHDWIFVVDSDEVVSAGLQMEIAQTFKNKSAGALAYTVPIQLFFLGNAIQYSGQQSKKAVRFFNRHAARFNQALVHESVITDSKPAHFKNPLQHHSYLTLEDYFLKMNRYTSLGAKAMAQNSNCGKRHKVLVSFPFQFLKFYFLKFGFLDGYYGFLWCMLSAFYPVVKYAKYEELNLPGLGNLALDPALEIAQ
jgi:glycosyltransferase involved in cell wall biosynthesis